MIGQQLTFRRQEICVRIPDWPLHAKHDIGDRAWMKWQQYTPEPIGCRSTYLLLPMWSSSFEVHSRFIYV